MNTSISSSMTISQKRCRILLITALTIIAALILKGFFDSLSKEHTNLSEGILGNGFLLLILVLAFRGSQLSMKLTKGCAVLFAMIIIALLLITSISVFRGIPLPQTPNIENSISFLVMIIAVIFLIWVFFFSTDVKSFIDYQRAIAHQKQLQKIKQK